jgi:hypothetical protein
MKVKNYYLSTLIEFPFALKDGQKIAFTYNKKQNVDGICMAEDMIVEIIAIRLLEDQTKPGKKECTDMNDPVKTEWGRSLMMKEKVYRMWKFNYQDGYAYYFLSPDGNLLFDCQGNKCALIYHSRINALTTSQNLIMARLFGH